MKMMMYSILDGKSGIYNQPFPAVSRGVALRMFTDLVNDQKTTIARHPEDYTICEVGSFEDTTGSFESHTVPIPLGNAASYIVHQATPVPSMNHALAEKVK